MHKQLKKAQSGNIVIILSVLLAVAVLLAVVAATYAWTSSQQKSGEESTQSPVTMQGPVTYIPVKPVTVNLNDNRGRVLYLGISLKVRGEEEVERVRNNMPQIRNLVLLTVNGRKAESIESSDSKQQLAEDIRDALAQPADKGVESFKIERVLFTDFVVQ